MIKQENPVWVFYLGKEHPKIPNCGKWMYFFDDHAFADKLVQKAVAQKVVDEAKVKRSDEGVCCFYIDGHDLNAHKRVITFFLNNDLIKRTKAGRLYNISFKFDRQTYANEYDSTFKPAIRLANFVDLTTGAFIK